MPYLGADAVNAQLSGYDICDGDRQGSSRFYGIGDAALHGSLKQHLLTT